LKVSLLKDTTELDQFLPIQSAIAMATLHSMMSQSVVLPTFKPKPKSTPIFKLSQTPLFSRDKRKTKSWAVRSVVEESDVIPVQSTDSTDQQEGVVVSRLESEGGLETELVAGFGSSHEGRLSFEGAGEFQGFSSSGSVGDEVGKRESEEMEKLIDRTINGTIVLAAGTFAITKLLTIDSDYWHVSLSAILSDCFLFLFLFVK
jgi:protein Mpv17